MEVIIMAVMVMSLLVIMRLTPFGDIEWVRKHWFKIGFVWATVVLILMSLSFLTN